MTAKEPNDAKHRAPRRVDVYERRDAWPSTLDSALEDAGFDVRLHDDPTQLLASALRDRPAAFVVRVEMPTDGFSLCGKLRKRKGLKDVPLLLMSSTEGEDAFDRHRRRRTAADAYVTLPAEPESVTRALLSLVDDTTRPRPRSLVEQAQALIDARRDRRRRLKGETLGDASSVRQRLETFASALRERLPQTPVSVSLLQPPHHAADVPRILLATLRDQDTRPMLGAAKRMARLYPVNMAMQVLSWEGMREQCRRGDIGPVRALARSFPIIAEPAFVVLRRACRHALACRRAFGDRLVAYVVPDLEPQPRGERFPALLVLEDLEAQDASRVEQLARREDGESGFRLGPLARSRDSAEKPDPAIARVIGDGTALLGHAWTERPRLRVHDAALAPLEDALGEAMARHDWPRVLHILHELARKTSKPALRAAYLYQAAAIHVERIRDEDGAIGKLGELLALDPMHEDARALMRALLTEQEEA